ncbi:KamA family radical SAM protein [candidate division KSB1 bacterium]
MTKDVDFYRDDEPPGEVEEPPGKAHYNRVSPQAGTINPAVAGSSVLFPSSHPPVFFGDRQSPSTTRFRVSPRSHAYLKRFYPQAGLSEWNDWHWQIRNRIRNVAQLERLLRLSEDEQAAIVRRSNRLPLRITPYYASLLNPDDPQEPLRRTMVPVFAEHIRSVGEADDPLHEDHSSPVPGLIHRYPDRVLFLATDLCSTYCRYCTRSRIVGNGNRWRMDLQNWEKAIAYIESNRTIRDVLISGGDPLILSDERIEFLLSRLRRISHVEILRIGTKTPVVLPQRITTNLVRMLKRHHPLFMSIHFTHPDELTTETAQACERLADAGIPLGSQTVLLAGINDDPLIMKRLCTGLLRIRIKPYYLYQCDPVPGTAQFRTPVRRGVEIIEKLRGHTSGYAVPIFVVDTPGGGGKVPLGPDYYLGREENDIVFRNYEGKLCRYPDLEDAVEDKVGALSR